MVVHENFYRCDVSFLPPLRSLLFFLIVNMRSVLKWIVTWQRLVVCGTDSRGFDPWTSTNACRHVCRCVDQKGLATMLTSIESAGITPEVNLRNSMQARKHASENSTLALKPRADITTEVQNGGISGLTKRTYVLQKFFQNKKGCSWNTYCA